MLNHPSEKAEIDYIADVHLGKERFAAQSAKKHVENAHYEERLELPNQVTARFGLSPEGRQIFNQIHNENEELISRENQLFVYPNPASGNVIVSGLYSGVEHMILLRNSLGQTVASYKTTHSTSSFDLSEVSSGIYFIEVMENGVQIHNQKLIIEK